MNEDDYEYVEEVEDFLKNYLEELIKKEQRQSYGVSCDYYEDRGEVFCKGLTKPKDDDPAICWDCKTSSDECRYGKISVGYVVVCDEFIDHDINIMAKIRIKQK